MVVWKPLVGCICLLIVFLTIIVGGVFKAFFNQGNEGTKTIILLGKKELEGSQRLLRYATAILAFLSLLTTAKGMKSFVFSEESWMAYIASFSVQSILVVFSLLLCRFFVQVTVLGWPLYIRRVVNGIMILFFSIALLVSSTFSFCFIANNAYRNTWPSDSETIIQKFLLQEIENLKIENNKRGKLIIDTIYKEIQKKIKSAVAESNSINVTNLEDEITSLVKMFPKKRLQKGRVDINKIELLRTYPQYKNDINFLCRNYKKFSDQYDSAVDLYNKVIDEVKNWNRTLNYEDIYNQSEQWINEINSMRIDLKNSKKNIRQLVTYKVNVDFSPIHSTYIQEVDVLRLNLLDVRNKLKKIYICSEKIKGNQNSGNNELDEILSDVYLLDVSKQENVVELIEKINNLAISISKGQNSNSNAIQNIVSAKNQINDYYDYLKLKNDIVIFEKDRIRRTYIVRSGNKDINKENNEIKYTTWRKSRNKDFTTFCTYVKSLPDVSNYDQKVKGSYNSDNVLEIAITYQRDLMGKLTEFEKAFNYFKYKYPVMAFFSAFIAIFFDLGSFFTGCFLYATEYFQTRSSKEEGTKENDANE